MEEKVKLETDVIEGESNLSELEFIETNIYTESSPKIVCKANILNCECELKKGEQGCKEDCINRLLFVECSYKCKCREFCANQRIKNREYSPIKVFQTEKKGNGLFAQADISCDDFIIEFVGEVIDYKESMKRNKIYLDNNIRHLYFVLLRSNAIIDATIKGNISRYINHSCDPNSAIQKWTVNGELRIGVFCIRDIKKDEEITIDYQYELYGKEAQKCYCGSEKCRGWIGIGSEENENDNYETDNENDNYEIIQQEKKDKPEIDIKIKPVEIDTSVKEEIPDDPKIEEQINELSKSGLNSISHAIIIARLMIQIKSMNLQIRLLKILSACEKLCLRFFIGYNGLQLLQNWMSDVDIFDSNYCFAIELINALSSMPILNKNELQKSNILTTVQSWKIERKRGRPKKTKINDDKTALKTAVSKLLKKWKHLKGDIKIPLIINRESKSAEVDVDWEEEKNDPYSTKYYTRVINKQRKNPIKDENFETNLNIFEDKQMRIHEERCKLFGYPLTTNALDMPHVINRITGEYVNINNEVVPPPPNHHLFKYKPFICSTNPDDYHLPEINLPKHWKYAIDNKGRIYYYHEKVQQPQWSPPINILPLDSKEESEIDSDESETSTDDSEIEELTEMLEYLKRKASIVTNSSQSNESCENADVDVLTKQIEMNMRENPLNNLNTKVTNRLKLCKTNFIQPRSNIDKLRGIIKNNDEKLLEILSNEYDYNSLPTELKFVDDEEEEEEEKDETNEDQVKEEHIEVDQDSIKMEFRDQIKEFIRQILLRYRKKSCEHGRIICENDFMFLINKFTYNVFKKQIEICTQNNVKMKLTAKMEYKIKIYIKEYMGNYPGLYKRKYDEKDYEILLEEI